MSRKNNIDVIQRLSEGELASIVSRSENYAQVLRFLGLQAEGRNATSIARQIRQFGIPTTHFRKGSRPQLRAENGYTYKNGKIWSIPEELFRDAVITSVTFSEALRKLGIPPPGRARQTLAKRAASLGLDLSHFRKFAQTMRKPQGLIPLADLLVEHAPYYKSSTLKARLIASGLLQETCYECNNGPSWNNRPLSLQLDHINGVNNDNRLENLRILCPNCHSQTATYAGKKLRIEISCKLCAAPLSAKSARMTCSTCEPRRTPTAITDRKLSQSVTRYGIMHTIRVTGLGFKTIKRRLQLKDGEVAKR